MSTTKRVAKNTSYLLISSIISYVSYFFALIYMARYLGVAQFGIINLAISFTGIFGIFTDLGLNMLTVREVSRDISLKSKYIANTTAIKSVFCTLTLIAILIVSYIIGYDPQTIIVIFLIILAIVVSSFFEVFFSIYQAMEEMEHQAITMGLDNIFMLSAVILATYLQLDIVAIASIYLIRNLLVLAYMFIVYIRKFELPKIEFDLQFWKPVLKESFPFALSGVFLTLFIWIPSIILSIMAGKSAVGFYGAPNKLIYFFLSLYSVYMVAVFPVMSIYYKKTDNSLKFIFARSFKYTLIICLPVTVFISLLAPQIINAIYGPEFMPSSIALSILVWTIVLVSLNGISANLLGSANRQGTVIKATIIGIVLNIALSVFLISKLSFIGASIATIITDITMISILLYSILRINYADYKLFKDVPKVIISTSVMLVVIIVLKDLYLPFLVVLAAISYITSVYLIKIFDQNDYLIFKKVLKIS